MAYDETIDAIKRRNWGAIILLNTALGFLMVLVSRRLDAQNMASLPDRGEATKRRMFVDPSSTTVSFNKVRLIVGPLTPNGKFYVGSYQIKVVPYFLKSETGTLKLDAPDETVRKFAEETEVKFRGKATSNKSEKVKVVTGTATPLDKDNGSLIFSLETDNGQMTFKTSYHFAK
jgi:hypothetical protein